MCFGVATIDLEKKVFKFKCIAAGKGFPIGETYPSLEISNSCLVCVLYKGSTMDTSMKYAAQRSYSKEYKNCWTMSIQFTKCLNAHLKYVRTQSELISTIESYPFSFKKREGDEQLLIGLRKIKNQVDLKGWTISPLSPIPDGILKADVDCVEVQQEFGKLQSRIIPSIEFSVFVFNEEAATDELDKYLDIDGITTDIFIKRQKE